MTAENTQKLPSLLMAQECLKIAKDVPGFDSYVLEGIYNALKAGCQPTYREKNTLVNIYNFLSKKKENKMSLFAKESGSWQKIPEGTYIARCYSVIDLGTQQSNYQGDVSQRRKVRIMWETPMKLMEDGRPFSVLKQYTLSLSTQASLRKDLEAWRGKTFTEEELKGFDLQKILGTYCFLGVIHNDEYVGISSIMSMMPGVPKPEGINPLVFFSLDDYNSEVFHTFSDKLKALISQSPEWIEINLPQLHPVDDFKQPAVYTTDDVPF